MKIRQLALAAISVVSTVSAATLEEKIKNARAALTTSSRVNGLEDSDYVFNFLNPPERARVSGAGGSTVSANAGNFPGIIGNGMAMTIGFLGPCGLNTPHTHPRATEFNFAVNGTLISGMLQENGARYVLNEVHPGSAVVFPIGSIHFTMNNECEPMIFVAAFNHEDPGTVSVAQRYFGITPGFVAASLGDFGIEEVQALEAQIPDNVALGVDECLKRCHITRKGQPTLQRQPRIRTNEFPPQHHHSGSKHHSSSASAKSSEGIAAGSMNGFITTLDANGNKEISKPVIIAFVILGGVMLLGYVVLGIMFCVKKRREKKNKGFRPIPT